MATGKTPAAPKAAGSSRPPTDLGALNRSFDAIEAGNTRARKAQAAAPVKATPAKRAPAKKAPPAGPPPTAPPAGSSSTSSAPPAGSSSTSSAPAAVQLGGGGQVVETGSGFILGLLVWGWVVMPFLRGGPGEVKKVLMAKFLNKSPDGQWLP